MLDKIKGHEQRIWFSNVREENDELTYQVELGLDAVEMTEAILRQFQLSEIWYLIHMKSNLNSP